MKRREFFNGLLASTASLAVAPAALAATPATPRSTAPGGSTPGAQACIDPNPDPATEPAMAEPPWGLIAPLAIGDEIGLGWHVVDLTPVRAGAAVLALRHATAGEARVHLCRKGEAPRGPAQSDTVDLLLMNRGDGAAPTEETLGRVLNVLAELIRVNERDGAILPDCSMTHAARLSFYQARRALL